MSGPSDAVLERAFLDEACVRAGWTDVGAHAAEVARLEEDRAPGLALAAMARALGERGVLALMHRKVDEGAFDDISWRAVCLARERLAYESPLLELAFAMQGLGSHSITAHGTEEQRARYLPKVRSGEHVAGFALTEADAGSDLSQIGTRAIRDADTYVITGEKVLISNAPIGDVFTVFAATAPMGEPRRVSAFVVPGDASGLSREATRVLGGHPIGRLRFDGVRVPMSARLGAEGDGMRIALGTLHRFRTTVGAAALGMGQRALDETVRHVSRRRQFGAPLAELQAVQMGLADMACDLESARLLVYRAAARLDEGAGRAAEARAGSMAKLVATEAAFRVIDRAVQLHGGAGVCADRIVSRLYEDVRALRIYEGASDIQRVLIARHLLREASE